jgi:hypothetical protein
MTLQYITRVDEGYLKLVATDPDGGNYVELAVPDGLTEAEHQLRLTEFFEDLKAQKVYEENLQPDFTRNFRDQVYMNGEIKRTDYSTDRVEALPKINELVAAFPEYTADQLTCNPKNVIGNYGNYRPPYANDSISFYDFTTPTAEKLETYGCTVDTYGDDLLQWHGIKHDMTTLTKSAKFVFTQNHATYIQNPPVGLPTNRSIFYARIHEADGTVSPWVDIYIISTNNYMRKWCTDNGLTFPLPDNVAEQPWCFSVVYNEQTGVMNSVKAYIRHRYPDE